MKPSSEKRTRLHYLDWLRVLALFGVFIFHSVHPFDFIDWHIKNTALSLSVSYLVVFLYPWGMPLFFMISGAGTFFALQRRDDREYTIERVQRLLIPYIVGSIILTPIQAYYEMIHKGLFSGSFQTFLIDGTLFNFYLNRVLAVNLSPMFFGALGYHLWFLGFLFMFSLLALPIFRWLNGETGSGFIETLVGLVSKRTGILLWVVPLALTQIALRPSFPNEHDWAGFVYEFIFFIYGFLLFSDQRFLKALKKDWWIILVLSLVSTVLILSRVSVSMMDTPSVPPSLVELLITWGVFSINSWSWTVLLLIFGMNYLDFDNTWLKYGKQAILPFFLVHQPVIIVFAFYVVQWDASILIKLLSIVCGSLVAILGIYELLIKRIKL
jgi:peptidoglycan/LPS O-acetylase OafA/YrhL